MVIEVSGCGLHYLRGAQLVPADAPDASRAFEGPDLPSPAVDALSAAIFTYI